MVAKSLIVGKVFYTGSRFTSQINTNDIAYSPLVMQGFSTAGSGELKQYCTKMNRNMPSTPMGASSNHGYGIKRLNYFAQSVSVPQKGLMNLVKKPFPASRFVITFKSIVGEVFLAHLAVLSEMWFGMPNYEKIGE